MEYTLFIQIVRFIYRIAADSIDEINRRRITYKFIKNNGGYNMTLDNVKDKYNSFSKAVDRLEESLKRDISDELVIDAVIQRFEFTYELGWKLLKLHLSFNGIAEVRSPRETFKESFSSGIINEGNIWIDMLDDRNITSHTYDEEEAQKIYWKIKNRYFILFKTLRDSLTGEMK